MTIITYLLIGLGSLMYLEGLFLATLIGLMVKPNKWVWPLLLFCWPVALPLLGGKVYLKYKPIIQELQNNPFMGALLGLQSQQNPLAALLATGAPTPMFDINELHEVESHEENKKEEKGEQLQ